MKKVDVKESAVGRETRIRKQWNEQGIFEQSIQNREGAQSFVFYEGPPTANGLPHVGHALGRAIKDLVARYKTMAGYKVLRKAGWDTHGLPVELGVEKQLGISGKHEIEKYGIEPFIQKCKESVFTYEKQWREFTESIGYWVDMDDPYVTLENPYIESVWNILGTIHEKGLLYKGHRVSPYCPSCQTSLSSHEVAQGYKTVKDLSATVKFKVKDSENEYFLGWTTTPWTLPANVALAVHPNMEYVKAKQEGYVYIVAKERVQEVLKENYEVLSVHKGEELVNTSYTAPFPMKEVTNGYHVIAADFVTADSGTGLVHIAPAYGEDDYKVVQSEGLSFLHVVDEKGEYTDAVPFLKGKFVKDCDVDIVRYLAKEGLLYHKEKYEHSYPHCWRCDSPLLYYAGESWLIRTTEIKETFLRNNDSVKWYPDHMKHGRFGKFLENMVDWNISRNRYWGTPLNVWECESCDHQFAPKSIAELRKHSTKETPEDLELHKPYVDEVQVCCEKCGSTMNRTPEVIDVWFDSGSMPFAQYHYPFENKELFEEQFPADVIAEGIDQTRGWFYSLLAVSALYTGKVPYKRVLSLGHVLDEEGQKMSKSKGNALDPVDLVNQFGADALRWALLVDSAPWNAKRFSERTVLEAKSKFVDTLVNVYSFYVLYANLDEYNPKEKYEVKRTKLDEWVLSRLHSTTKKVRTALDDYQFTNAAREIAALVDEVSNWYVRRSRNRFWESGMNPEKAAAYETLHEVLVTISKLIAPFTPFVAEDIHLNLEGRSVHLADYPVVNESLIQPELEAEMDAVLQVVELGRSNRNQHSLKVKQPLAELVLLAHNENDMDWESYRDIIMDELNVKAFHVELDETKYTSYQLKLNFKTAGPKFGKSVNAVNGWLKQLSKEEVQHFVSTERAVYEVAPGEEVVVTAEDVLVEKVAKSGFSNTTNGQYTVMLDTNVTEELLQEGVAREFIRAVQEYRKQLNLPVNLRVDVILDTEEELQQTLTNHKDLLEENLLVKQFTFGHLTNEDDELSLGETKIRIKLNAAN
ncbi:isoleucine--tRNA ligase [Bacillus mycoides]|uniref:isoleucine--tRNA ligase n=1 Tax=Bacillus mycoides TaxID=1405 RepID=UPI001C034DFD|nr:isoleucine--tRNA ligase [Bacillus mycoides]QWG50364.1 isoleucine--tRNA ligase [Bacillus mycoides]QWG55925.1 isoleucine--tRNA ligase [Bacillus mycoides]QWG71265.1 isoleucine--tRNA ligase [Bacillus mycoides]QWH22921.1 isoleucine--tRNA ligase [Bacillus mycoides]QWH34168.1 isoleucine--tRNA ligase [Bacillus mycoides]